MPRSDNKPEVESREGGVKSLQVEDLVVELDKVAPVAGVARADGGHAGSAEVDGIHVVGPGDVPGGEAVCIGVAVVEEVAVASLHLLDESRLSSVWVGDSPELKKHASARRYTRGLH